MAPASVCVYSRVLCKAEGQGGKMAPAAVEGFMKVAVCMCACVCIGKRPGAVENWEFLQVCVCACMYIFKCVCL